ncbi:MAG: STAS domain-containing protein [Candidatus Margulisbacteria bacterium]|nr:STAS domain-containing protein [Candidatus Margulisiibacteriota bacterium]
MKNINVSYIDDVCYLVINGDIEFNESEQLLDKVNSLMIKPHPKIVIDLGNCKYIDSLGLSTFNRVHEISKKNNKKLILCNLDKDCEDILFMTTLWNKVPILKDLKSCIQSAN